MSITANSIQESREAEQRDGEEQQASGSEHDHSVAFHHRQHKQKIRHRLQHF